MLNNSIKIEIKTICITKDKLKSVKKQILKNFPDISIKQAVDEIFKDSFALYRQAILKALKEWSNEEIIVYQVTREKKLRRIKSRREQISLLSPSLGHFLKTADKIFGPIKKYHLTRCRQEYKKTKNPLFAWDVYECCRQWEIPIPAWVSAYLAGVATKILKATKTWVKGEDRSDRTLALSLGFDQGGGYSKFKQYSLSLRNQKIFYLFFEIEDKILAEKKAGIINEEEAGMADTVKIKNRVAGELEKEGIKLSPDACKRIFNLEEKKCFKFIEDKDVII